MTEPQTPRDYAKAKGAITMIYPARMMAAGSCLCRFHRAASQIMRLTFYALFEESWPSEN